MRKLLISAICACIFCSTAALADTIYLRSGKIIQAENVTVTDSKVHFELFGGKMAIDRQLVIRIERNEITAQTGNAMRSSISGTPYRRPTMNNAGSGGEGGGEGDTATDADQRKETLQNFIDIKLQLQRELQFANAQIQTLRSVIYAKAAITSDTSEERTKLQEYETRKQNIEAQINQLTQDARRAGLLPADIRALEQATIATAQTGGQGNTVNLGGQQPGDPRDANVSLIQDTATEDDSRNSDVVLDEKEDDSRSRK